MFQAAVRLLCVYAVICPMALFANDNPMPPQTLMDAERSRQIEDFVAGITQAFDENPHSCYEADEEERPDPAARPQS